MAKRERTKGNIIAYRRRPRRGEVLAHNHVMHTRDMLHGANGFRWFSMILGPGWAKCPCGWRPDLGEHYAAGSHVRIWRQLKKKYRTQAAIDRYVSKLVFRALAE
jgi:hypothetical protein